MPLGPGTRVGPYEIVVAIGAGGMGEVYRARDVRLGRDVAVKVLPESFATDPDRLARFEREAQLLASLNHQNIAIIHGLEDAGGVRALVMELIEGPTLADRIAQGPVPIEEALPIARQIAEALEAAHERGVIHRDLKPANIKITPDGQVKVLDFGLAKVFESAGSGQSAAGSQHLSMSPTLSAHATYAGLILGTAAYMSPEQARGRAVDQRTDIWAFGCVLFEMLTGTRAFEGEDVSETLARVIEREPDWTRVPPQTRRLLKSCLQKDRKKRLQAIGDIHLLLDDPAPPAAIASRPRMARTPWVIAAGAMLSVAILALVHFREVPPESRVVRSTLLPPDNTEFNSDFTQGVGLPTLSPDGTRIVFGARTADGKTPLWVRSLDALTAQPLAGTDGASFPFWSPDSRFIAFFAGGKLKKIDGSGGPALTLADAPNGRGGSWSRDGVIVFEPSNIFSPLLRVSSAGGATSPVSSEFGSFPWFLPDGRHFLYQGEATDAGLPIRVGSLDGSPSKVVIGEAGSNPVYAQGRVLFVRERTLMAQPFDTERRATTGDAIPVAEQIQSVLNSGRVAAFSVSNSGLLAYRGGAASSGYTLTWVDRNGAKGAEVGASHFVIGDIQFSPDRKSVALAIQEQANIDIWIYDVSRGLRTRFTFDQATDTNPVWSPDGRSIIFRSNRKGHFDLYRKAVDGVGAEELLYADEFDKLPTSWSADGSALLYQVGRPTNGFDVWVLPVMPKPGAALKPSAVLQEAANEGDAQFSPDGRWVLYVSDESRRYEVYAAPFSPVRSGPAGKRQISIAGMTGVAGGTPRWRADGREIVYVDPDRRLMATEITLKGDTLDVGLTRPLFGLLSGLNATFDVSIDGQRFLLLAAPEQKTVAPITLVQNWAAGLTD